MTGISPRSPASRSRRALDAKLQLAVADAVVSVGQPATIVVLQPSTGAVLAVAQNSQANDKGPIAYTGLYPAGSNLDAIEAAAAIEKDVAPKDMKAELAGSAAR